ncbi:hypothetical protein ACFQ0O_41705 [Saccharopolyspora spinosporotrichia]
MLSLVCPGIGESLPGDVELGLGFGDLLAGAGGLGGGQAAPGAGDGLACGFDVPAVLAGAASSSCTAHNNSSS